MIHPERGAAPLQENSLGKIRVMPSHDIMCTKSQNSKTAASFSQLTLSELPRGHYEEVLTERYTHTRSAD